MSKSTITHIVVYLVVAASAKTHLLNAMKALYSTEILCTQDGEYPVL